MCFCIQLVVASRCSYLLESSVWEKRRVKKAMTSYYKNYLDLLGPWKSPRVPRAHFENHCSTLSPALPITICSSVLCKAHKWKGNSGFIGVVVWGFEGQVGERVNQYLIWFHLFFQGEWLNICGPERCDDTDEEYTFKATEFLVKTGYAPQTLEDLAHGRYLNILWVIKEEMNPKKQCYSPWVTEVTPDLGLLDRGLWGATRDWKVILNWTELRTVIWTKSWKVCLSHTS